MPPTQKELAKLAGVSAGTVSNVISGSTNVSERSRQKVLEAIRVLNYQPNLIARSLRTNRTRTLGIVVPDITIPFFPKIIRGAESAARVRGYFLIVLDSEGSSDREADMIALLRAQRVEGILLVTAGSTEAFPDRLNTSDVHFPVVCLDRLPADLHVDSVCVDDCGAAEMAIAHLMSLGHTSIAAITGPLSLRNEQERLRGYRQALQRGGRKFDRSLVWSGSFEQEEVAKLCQGGMLHPAGRPTALFATNGVTGLAALRSLYSIGLSTPKNFSFITFDEINAEDFFRPSITSVVQPTFDMGYKAVELLLDRIEKGEDAPRRKIRLPAMLKICESSGKPLKPVPARKTAARKQTGSKTRAHR
ncbi:MAG: LacI family DNA-binding transcriptional regulator [Edaphobacter sp.]|uniref:LacI family DNA-binding transcriptional regulator n=1 Tax=Edaphobacter sp. TaxID=1934404 RepID=UPI00239B61D4|nr:LacI family DNA-binding transcriptional regulator [Edaphobacter sp.]MDE1177474.1 LacI family DNA-binding transcriptional regulator [Edaphobacter sp.]